MIPGEQNRQRRPAILYSFGPVEGILQEEEHQESPNNTHEEQCQGDLMVLCVTVVSNSVTT